ncbi:MAG: ATP phosphoribosyltransferase regulatory subunit [Spirochaetales bacterium]|nr:ATP phosphoribosyltransferase regulatory subunit [Spirochaetales bacterium]
MKKNNLFLHTPPGTKPLYPEEALLRNIIECRLCSYFECWDYKPVEPPMIDYFDIYTPFLTERQRKGSIRFVDRDGNLVLLRNDITLFAAKALAVRMGSRFFDERFKYYYCGQIMRSREKDAPEEYYQIGCEIVSKRFTHEEFEILCLLLESAKYLGIEDFRLHIGDISFYNALLGNCSERAEILTAVRKCDLPLLQELVNNAELSDEIKSDLLTCAHFMGNTKELKSADLSSAGKKALEPLLHLVSSLEKAGYAEYLTIDLSELPDLDYYNGIIFNMYASGAEMPLVSGGRYDLLFKELGLEKSAVGFSYWLYPLEKVLHEKLDIEETSENVKIGKNSFVDDFQNAVKKIASGKKVRLNYE